MKVAGAPGNSTSTNSKPPHFFLDIRLVPMQTFSMLARLVLSHVVLGAVTLTAQQPAAPPQSPADAATPVHKLPADPAKLTARILGSYYHPDNLPGLDCDVSIDWQTFFGSAQVVMPPDRMQAIQALKIHVRAIRGETPDVTFDWTEIRLTNADQLEASMRQAIDGFFQMYWSMFASPPVRSADEIEKIEWQPDGSAKVYADDPNTHTVITVDSDGVPTQYAFNGAAVSGTIDAYYLPSPNPVPGDLRRISGIDVDEYTGANTMKASLSLNYQPVDTFFVPKNVSFQVIGAYTIAMDYSGCSVLSGTVAGE